MLILIPFPVRRRGAKFTRKKKNEKKVFEKKTDDCPAIVVNRRDVMVTSAQT